MSDTPPPRARWVTDKILGRKELGERLAKSRRRGSLALANGCFDLIHVGHIRYLKAAKLEADLLLVAINSDSSVRALKGEGRPLQTQEDRLEIIASLECVDFVTLFDENSVEKIIEIVEPDVHCKGTDYTPETVPERETVLRHGGRIAIVGDPKDHDTSRIIGKISR